MEFVEKESITKAVELDESLFKGRQIKVNWIACQFTSIFVFDWL